MLYYYDRKESVIKGGKNMALVKCPICGKEISPNAASCPYCGEPMQPQAVSKRKLTLTRKGSFWGAAINMEVYVDGILIGLLPNGGCLAYHITQGEHSMYAAQPAGQAAANMILNGPFASSNAGETMLIPAGNNDISYELRSRTGIIRNTWYFERT